nr:hypothetical protein [Angustibacter aerolatus]
MRGIQITEFGGPEVLTLHDDLPEPATDGLVRVAVTSAGVNFADTHQAEDSYLAPQTLPLVPGAEVVGRTDDGRRVVALLAGGGGYAEVAAAHPSVVFDLPDAVDDATALALVLQGTTAWHLLRTSARLAAGESVVVHAAAGGVGTIAVQAREDLRRRPGDRHRLDPREAAARARPGRRRGCRRVGPGRRRRRARRAARGERRAGRRRRPRDDGWAGVRRLAGRPGPVRAGRGVRDGGAGAARAGAGAVAHGALDVGRRLLAGARAAPARRAAAGHGGACSRWPPRVACGRSPAATTRSPRPPARTVTSARAAPSASLVLRV